MRTTTAQRTNATAGFAIRILPTTDLGNAMLIAEDEEGHSQPVGLACSINEAQEIAAEDLRGRLRLLERDADPGLCPWEYKLWARGLGGEYKVAAAWSAVEISEI